MCRRFADLVDAGYFTDCRFHRVVPGFIIQWGIPADPVAYKKWGDNKIKDDPVRTSNVQQTLSFATSGPDARGSQIFVNLSNNDGLDEQGCASPNAACARGAVLSESPHRAVLHRSPKCSTGSPNSRRSRAKSVNQPRSPTRRLPRYDGCTASLHKQNPVLLPRRLLLRRPLHIAGTRQPVSCKRPARQTQLHRPRSKGLRFLGSSTLPPDCPSMLAL